MCVNEVFPDNSNGALMYRLVVLRSKDPPKGALAEE